MNVLPHSSTYKKVWHKAEFKGGEINQMSHQRELTPWMFAEWAAHMAWRQHVYKHTQTICPESPCDITVSVCVIIKWLWQVVFAQAALSASVPHSASLVAFLWEMMGRSGRGSQTSAVCESDRADNAEVRTGPGRTKEEGERGFWSRNPWPRRAMIWWEEEAEEACGEGIPACYLSSLLHPIKGLLLYPRAYKL